MPDIPVKTKKDKSLVILIIVLILLLLAGFCGWLLIFGPGKNLLTQLPGIKQPRETFPTYPIVTASPKPTSQPTSTPRPLPHGKRGFSVSGGKQNAPRFSRGFLDPMDPEQGSEQKIIIKIENSVPISSVVTTVKTDNKNTKVDMNLTEGTKTNGTWQGSWTVDDTYLYNYKVEIVATAENGEQEVELTLR